MKFDIKEIDGKKILTVYKKHFLWFKWNSYTFEITDDVEYHAYVFNNEFYLSLTNEHNYVLYKLENNYLDKVKHISSEIKFKPTRHLKSTISIEDKIDNYYDRILNKTGFSKEKFIENFKNNKIYLPDQLIRINDKYIIILSSYYKVNIEESFYDIIGIENGSITYGKVPFLGIDEEDIDINEILPMLHASQVNIDIKTVFYKKDDTIVYPAAITLI